jgi:2,3-bisphosphoglycerate-independent phosphoglycerate mutase
MGERPIPELNGRTALEAANTPNMDSLAKEGACGLLHPIAPGIRAGSDTSHLALLGFDPFTTYTGRGPFEAAGIGMEVKEGDICFRCNFATVDKNGIVTDRRAGRIREGTDQLAKALAQIKEVGAGVKCFFKESVEHRGALVLRGEALSAAITDELDPHVEGKPVGMAAAEDGQDAGGVRTAQAVNEFVARSRDILARHPLNLERQQAGLPPANIILPRGPGVAPSLPKFEEHYKMKGAMVIEVGLLAGIGHYLQMSVIHPEGATGSLDTDVDSIGRTLLSALENHDFVLCNIKGADVAGHNGDAGAKVKILERIDEMLGRMLLPALKGEAIFILTADHATPVTLKDHSGDAVPIALWGPGVLSDAVAAFDERTCAYGSLGHVRGVDILPLLTNLMGVQEKFGA